MKAWILGGSGMVGKCLTTFLQKKGVDCVAEGRESVDITSYEDLEKSFYLVMPTHIFNCAAYTAVDDAEIHRDLAMRVNGSGPGLLGQLARVCNVRVIHISTDYVFSGDGKRPFQEDDVTCPINYYGVTKREGEKRLLEELPSACIVRTSWVYGAGGKNFISSIIHLLQTKEVLEVADDQIGRPTFCQDLVEALYEVKDASGVYHFASEGPASRYEIAQAVFLFMQKHGIASICKEILPVSSSRLPAKAPRPFYSVLDTTRYESVFGKHPRPWVDTLAELFL
ncbi:MAG: dTDP-4-dehydrorhamnose reductase [Chlamydiia bacterium]